MPSSDERTRAFNTARKAQLAGLPRIQADVIKEIERQLRDAAETIVLMLSKGGAAWRRSQLLGLQREIAAALEMLRGNLSVLAQSGMESGWLAGGEMIRSPLAAAGVVVAQHLNTRSLTALQGALTRYIEDVSLRALNRINAEIAQVMIGTRPVSEAITNVQRLLKTSLRQRARTIVVDEIGRAYSMASQARMTEAAVLLPGLRKRWIKSGKLHPRPSHVGAHGQKRLVDEPFKVAGENLMYPRDPKGSLGNIINCGCLSIPVTDGSTWGESTVRLNPFDASVPLRVVRDSGL